MPSGGYRSPTVRHKRLTAELRRLRAESGLTRDDVASRLEWHPTKVTRIETGQWTNPAIRFPCSVVAVRAPSILPSRRPCICEKGGYTQLGTNRASLTPPSS